MVAIFISSIVIICYLSSFGHRSLLCLLIMGNDAMRSKAFDDCCQNFDGEHIIHLEFLILDQGSSSSSRRIRSECTSFWPVHFPLLLL